MAKLTVFSHKPCWRSVSSPSGYATDGGFPFQMQALSELFEATTLVVPCYTGRDANGEEPIRGQNLRVAPVTAPSGRGVWRKLGILPWLYRNRATLIREIRQADAVHTPIPGDIGTIGMLLAWLLRKPLFVRHCGNWSVPRTSAERFWKWFMERFAGGRNVMLATGGASEPPSRRNPNLRWIFSSSLTEPELTSCCVRRDAPPWDRTRLIIVCRQEREKGTGVLIESLPLIVRDLPAVSLDVVGNGGALGEFRQLAATLDVSDRVTFHGKVDHATVIRLLQQADLFCFPTVSSEGFPKVVLEALACGLPVVTTRVSVLPELVGAGSGVLIDEATPTAVAAAVTQCVSDAVRYRALAASALETAQQYSLERWRDTIGGYLSVAWKEPSIRCAASKA